MGEVVSVTAQDRELDFGQEVKPTGNAAVLLVSYGQPSKYDLTCRDEVAYIPDLVFDPGFGATSPLVSAPVTIGTERVDRDNASRRVAAAVQSRWEEAEEAAAALEVESGHLSAVRHASASDNFRRLKEAGNTGISVALERLLEDWRPLWLYFLQSSTGERPARGTATVAEAADAWHQWGRLKGLI